MHLSPNIRHKKQNGQIVIEYILLLVLGVSLAMLIVTAMVGRSSNPGFVITAWNQVLKQIGADLPDAPQ